MGKNTPNKAIYGGGVAAALIAGFTIGAFWKDIPLVKFKGDVDFGALISLLSLLASIYLVPFLINRYFSRRNHIGAMLHADLEDAMKCCDEVAEQYRDLHLDNKTLKVKDQKILLMRFRNITNILTTIADNSDGLPEFGDFRSEVLKSFTDTVYVDYTEKAIVGKMISDEMFLEATKSMATFSTKMRRYRYRVPTS